MRSEPGLFTRCFQRYLRPDSILAKIGISGVEFNLGTAIRTIVVLIMAWIIVIMR